MSSVNAQHVVFERGARAAQSALQAAHLHDAALQLSNRIVLAQDADRGLTRNQLPGEAQ